MKILNKRFPKARRQKFYTFYFILCNEEYLKVYTKFYLREFRIIKTTTLYILMACNNYLLLYLETN